VNRAAAGEEIILSKAGRPVARLMPLAERMTRQPGLLRDWQIPDDLFLEPADEEAAAEGMHTDAFGIGRSRAR
jgi:prevent-host-death family protein